MELAVKRRKSKLTRLFGLLSAGFNVETVEYKNISFTVWDVGGQDKVSILILFINQLYNPLFRKVCLESRI